MFEGKLLSSIGDAILEKKDGTVQSVSKSNIQNVDFPKLPLGLITRSTLVWMLSSHAAGQQEAEISYLTNGISWHAEYVIVLDKEDKKIELSAWVSIDNQSGTAYENAKIKLIAGEVHRAVSPPQPYRMRKVMATMAMEGAEDRQFQEKTFFEYHLYVLNRPATIKNHQIKQLSLFPTATANVKKIYKYDGSQDSDKVKINVEFVNSKNEGIGIPLPAGKVRVYKKETDQSQEFVGEDQMNHTPKDEKVRLCIGDAFDVVGERKQKEIKNLGTRAKQETIEIKLRNHKESDIEVTAIEHLSGEWEISSASHQYEKKDAETVEFKVPVKKDGETIIEYTVMTRW